MPARSPWLVELRATVWLAVPLVLTQLSQIAIQTTDVVMMGWLGKDELAAGALTGHTFYAFFLLGLGVCSAVAPLAAQALGANRRRDVRRYTRQGLYAALIVCLPVWLILAWFGPIARLLGQDPVIVALGQPYMVALLAALPPALGYVVLRCFCAALNRPTPALVAMAVSIPLNGLLNYGLMFGEFGLPDLGLVGAGVSTVITEWLMFGGLLLYVVRDRGFRRYGILVRWWKADMVRLRQVFAVGLPIGGSILMEALMFSAAVYFMGIIGDDAIAAHQIAIQCAAISFMVPLGVAQAAVIRVGHAAGRHDRAGLRRAGFVAYGVACGFMAAMAILFLAIPEILAGAYLDRADPANADVIALAVGFFAIAALFQVFDGAQVIGQHVLRGLKDTRVPMVVAGIGYWLVGMPASALLAFGLGLEGTGVWLGLAAGLSVVAAILLHRFNRETQPDRVGRWFARVDHG
ncbi:MAG: MATE family efflux transporter [Alphaproteobacteria bacterium]